MQATGNSARPEAVVGEGNRGRPQRSARCWVANWCGAECASRPSPPPIVTGTHPAYRASLPLLYRCRPPVPADRHPVETAWTSTTRNFTVGLCGLFYFGLLLAGPSKAFLFLPFSPLPGSFLPAFTQNVSVFRKSRRHMYSPGKWKTGLFPGMRCYTSVLFFHNAHVYLPISHSRERCHQSRKTLGNERPFWCLRYCFSGFFFSSFLPLGPPTPADL